MEMSVYTAATRKQKVSFEESYYENAGMWATENFSAAEEQRIAALAGKLPPDVHTLLDVGCGNGMFLKYLGEMKGRHFDRLCGTDRSTAALDCVQSEKVQASIDSLPFSEGEFDAVVCMEVLEHLPQATYSRALNELSRIARRYILVSVPHDQNLRMSLTECTECRCCFNPNYHLRAFDQPAMNHLFDGRGFACSEVFCVCAERVVPAKIALLLRFLGVAKRLILQHPHLPMPRHAICPACGYSLAADKQESSRSCVQPSRTVGMMIRSALRVKSSWRWMGAVYERV